MAGMPWEVSGPETAPSTGNSAGGQTSGGMPWEVNPEGQAASQQQQSEPSILGSIGKTLGARADEIAAGMLSYAGDEKSNFAMRRAERTSQEAAQSMGQLSGAGRVAVQAADMGIGMGLGLIPGAGPAVAGSYFGAQMLGNELAQQRQTTGQYDLPKAATIATLGGTAGAVVGPLAGKALGVAAPYLARGVSTAASKVLPTAGQVVGKAADVVAGPAGNLVGGKVGSVAGQVIGRGVGGTARTSTDYLGNVVIPQAAKGAQQILQSGIGKSSAGGAAANTSMQMISNIGNGRPLMEGTGEAAEVGAIGGAGVHVAHPVVNTIARRVPTTIGMLRDNVTGNRFEPTSEPIPEQPQTAPNVTSAEQSAIPTGEPSQPSGAIPANEVGSIPGSQNFDPNAYGNGGVGGMGDFVQPGQGIAGGGIDVGGLASRAGEFASDIGQGLSRTAESVQQNGGKILNQAGQDLAGRRNISSGALTLWNQFKQDGLAGIISPKAVNQMRAEERTTEALGLPKGTELTQKANAYEGTADIMQQQLEGMDPSSPEYHQHTNAIVNWAMQSGSAAAHARSNQMAVSTEMPASSAYNDWTLHEGLGNKENAKNVAYDIYGLSPAEVMQEHNAIKNSKGIALPFTEGMSREQIEKYQTYESHHNATREAFLRGKSKQEGAMEFNSDLAKTTLRQLKETSPGSEMAESAQILSDNLDKLREIMAESTNGRPIDTERLEGAARLITKHATALGLMPKFKNMLGDAGTFNPVVDAEGWHNFSMRTRRMHATAPKGQYQDMLQSGELGISGIDLNKPASWVKPITNVVMSTVDRARSAATQAKGHAIINDVVNRPQRNTPPEGEAVNANLEAGDVNGASVASEQALNSEGIATGNVDLAASPATEVQQAQSKGLATRAQTNELARRGHPAADNENLTQEEAAMLLAHDDMVTQQRAQAGNEPGTTDVAGMAQRPAEPTPAPVPEPVVEPTVEAPQEPVAPFEGERAPTRLPEPEAVPEAVQEPQTQGQDFSQGNQKPRNPKFADKTDEQVEQIASDASDVLKKGKEDTTPEERIEARNTFREAIEEQETRRAEFEGIKRPNASPKGETSQEAVQEPTAAPKEVNQKAPRKLAEPESEPAKPTEEETATSKEEQSSVPKEQAAKEPEAVTEKYTVDDQIPVEHTDFKKGETSTERNNRVKEMARSLVKKAVAGIRQKPMKNSSIAEKAEAENLSKGIETAFKQADKLADEGGFERADAYAAIMSRPSGIKSLFENGYTKEDINGAVRSAIKKYKSEQVQMAKQHVQEADQIIRKRLGEAEVGRTREDRLSRVRADLLSKKGMTDKIIDQAIERAENVSSNYTAEQVIGHARKIVQENIAKTNKPVKPIPPEDHPIVKSRKVLQEYVKGLGASGKTLRDLMKIVDSATEVGGGAAGSRPSLTPEEIDTTIKQIHETLAEAAKTAQEAKTSSKTTVPERKKVLQENAAAASKAKAAAKQGEEKLRADFQNLEDQFKAQQDQFDKDRAAYQEKEKENASIIQGLKDTQAELKQQVEQARAEGREDLREEYENAPTESIKEFGNIVGEEFPTDVSSPNDPKFQEWMDKVSVAADILSDRGPKVKLEAQFLKKLSALLHKGLTNLEEMPDRPDLTVSQHEFNMVRDAYQEMKKGSDTNTVERVNAQWGTMGQRIRGLILGGAKEFNRSNTPEQLKTQRAKAMLEKTDVGDGGVDSPGIK